MAFAASAAVPTLASSTGVCCTRKARRRATAATNAGMAVAAVASNNKSASFERSVSRGLISMTFAPPAIFANLGNLHAGATEPLVPIIKKPLAAFVSCKARLICPGGKPSPKYTASGLRTALPHAGTVDQFSSVRVFFHPALMRPWPSTWP